MGVLGILESSQQRLLPPPSTAFDTRITRSIRHRRRRSICACWNATTQHTVIRCTLFPKSFPTRSGATARHDKTHTAISSCIHPPRAVHPAFGCSCTSRAAVRTNAANASISHALSPAGLLGALKLDIFLAACKGTFKLGLICCAVMYLTQRGAIPSDAPRVLSAIAFNIAIPCMLLTKVAQTLSAGCDPAVLMVPVAAACQVAVGALLGHFAAAWAVRDRDFDAAVAAREKSSAHIIAESVAGAAGLPKGFAASLVPPEPAAPEGLQALVQTACAFGNSLTLPLIMLLTLLPASMEVTATGYTAMFLMGWSPMFWTFGYNALTTAMLAAAASPVIVPQPVAAVVAAESLPRSRDWSGRTLEVTPLKPEYDPYPKPIDVELLPDDMTDLPPIRVLEDASSVTDVVRSSSEASSWAAPTLGPTNGSTWGRDGVAAAGNGAGSLAASRDARIPEALLLKAPAEPDHVWPILPPRLERALKAVQRVLNPPVVATLLGLALGCTPLGTILLHPGSEQARAMASGLPWELAVLLAACRSGCEVMALLGGSTLVLQAITLGGSMLKSGGHDWRSLLFPADRWESRILIATSIVRLLLMPVAALAIVLCFSAMGWLPNDPVCKLAILIQSCMPSAQNLVLLVNLDEATRPLAPRLAQLLLRQYILAIVPMTVWVSVFISVLGIPVYSY